MRAGEHTYLLCANPGFFSEDRKASHADVYVFVCVRAFLCGVFGGSDGRAPRKLGIGWIVPETKGRCFFRVPQL